MATVNGQEISNRYGGGIVFANNFTVNTNTPLDVRLTKTTKSELLSSTSWVRNSNGQYLVYTGMLVVVTSDTTASNNGIWEYIGPDDVANANPTDERNWVHLISGEISNTTIDAAIDAKIQGLDVPGYAQATITPNMSVDGSKPNSTLTIKGIQEVDGKIGAADGSDNVDFDIAIDGVYNESSNKIATQSTVTNAINGLNTTGTIQAVDKTTSGNITTLTLKGVKEINGIIAQGDGTDSFIVGDAKLNIQIGSADAFEVFSANKQSDSTIKLDGYVFKKDENNVISVIAETPVSESNKLVTKADINNLTGAMHYKGAISNPDNWPTTVKAGDVYISTVNRNFIHNEQQPPIEPGDMIVFNSENISDFTVVQSNLTLGTGDGQIAKNVGALADGKLVVGVNPATGSKGIKTVDFDVTNLTGITGKNERNLTYDNGTPDTSDATLFHSATIKDTFKVIGKNFTETINISSTNRSIKIARNAGDNDSTGIVVDLVWNTSIE